MTEDFQLRPAGARPSEAGAAVKSNTLLAIGAGALVAGTLDLTQACVLFGWDIPRVIAAGLLGQASPSGRRRNLCPRGSFALPYRLVICGVLLCCEPPTGFHGGTSSGVRIIL